MAKKFWQQKRVDSPALMSNPFASRTTEPGVCNSQGIVQDADAATGRPLQNAINAGKIMHSAQRVWQRRAVTGGPSR
jgi:hypothetical protein